MLSLLRSSNPTALGIATTCIEYVRRDFVQELEPTLQARAGQVGDLNTPNMNSNILTQSSPSTA